MFVRLFGVNFDFDLDAMRACVICCFMRIACVAYSKR